MRFLSVHFFLLPFVSLVAAQLPPTTKCLLLMGNYPFNNNQLYCPSFDGQTGSTNFLLSPDIATGNMAAAVVYDKTVYLFGGQICHNFTMEDVSDDSTCVVSGQEPVAEITVFNPYKNGTRNPTSLATPRYGHTATVLGESIWICGGVSNDIVIKTCEIYMPRGDYLVPDDDMVTLPMGIGLTNHVAVTLQRKLVIVGGYKNPQDPDEMNTAVLIYDPHTNAWTNGTSAPFPNLAAGAVVSYEDDESLLYCGGKAPDGSVYGTCWVYNLAANTWTQTGNLAAARQHHQMVLLEGEIFIIGGAPDNILSHGLRTVEKWDLQNKKAVLLPLILREDAVFTSAVPIQPLS